MPLSSLIEEIAAPHREFGIDIAVSLEGTPPDPVGRRDPGIIYGLGNLVENAVDFASSAVTIRATWSTTRVHVEITDDGPGFPPDVLAKIGEPYISKRGARRGSSDQSGLGLGLFIAKTLLERSGATLRFGNRLGEEGGAVVSAAWPRNRFEAPAAAATGAG